MLRLLRFIVRCPFSVERGIRLSDNDRVIYLAGRSVTWKTAMSDS